ncbi:MAG: carbohydrate-binding domain-containing protein [Oscillospiraceae bacterium]|nr:carbohydrate-binding domain-containing protein [Oscillospiraceae bacterium]
MKAIFLSILCLCLLLTVWGCDSSDPAESSTPTTVETAELFAQEQFSQRDRDSSTEDSIPVHLTAQGPVCEDRGISVGKDSITVRSPGKYRFFGEYHGSIVVDVDKNDHVHLILDNAVITAEQTAALYVKQAEKVVVTLKGTNRLLTEESFSTEGGNKIDAVIFAKDDLSFNGEGALFLQSPDHGIVCKDDLVFLGGSYDIKAQRHGISTEGSIRVGDGTFTLETQKDGMNTDNSVDPLSAYIYIARGSFTLQAGGDGISTDSALRIDDGSFILTAGGGSSKGETHYEEAPGFRPTSTAVTEDSSTGTKGINAADDILIQGGSFQINSADDGIHSKGNVEILGGSLTVESGDDGIHAEELLQIRGGEVTVPTAYEGLEGHCIEIAGGRIHIVASDDGLNAAGGADGSGMGRNDMFAVDKEAYITLSGGRLFVDSKGDGIDSNGIFTVTGGETYISGPSGGGNSALDCNGEATVTGGLFIAAGATGMATGFGAGSTQGSIFVSYSTQPSGSKVSLKNSFGEEILSWETTKSSSSIVLSCPQIKEGESYHLTVGQIEGDILMTDIVYGTSPTHPGGRR